MKNQRDHVLALARIMTVCSVCIPLPDLRGQDREEAPPEIEFISPLFDGKTKPTPTLPRKLPEFAIQHRDERRDRDTGQKVVTFRVDKPDLAERPPKKEKPLPEEIAYTPEQLDAFRKNYKNISLSATVYENGATFLRWRHDGNEYKAWSNVSFHHISGISGFKLREVTYNLFMGIGLPPSDWELGTNGHGLPPEFEMVEPHIVLVEGDENNSEALEPILALHEVYAKRGEELRHAHLGRVKARQEWEAYAAEHPEVPKDLVIHYWRGEGLQHLPPFDPPPPADPVPGPSAYLQKQKTEADSARKRARELSQAKLLARRAEQAADLAKQTAKKAQAQRKEEE